MNPTRRNFVAAGLATALPANLSAAPAARLDEPRRVETLTFEDLCHLPVKEAESVLGTARTKKMLAALEDFNAVLAYRKPAHAKFDTSFRDGGTSVYTGDGYTLTIWKGLSELQHSKSERVRGYLYGPDLRFTPEWAWGGPSISRVTFYPADVLEKLLG